MEGEQPGVHICEWSNALPSGHPFTVFANSLINLTLLVGAYYNCFGHVEDFWEMVTPMVYGDDNLMSISSLVIQYFNQRTLPDLLSPLGFTYTNESKNDSEMAVCRELSDVSFLKRGFRYDPCVSMWVAPLEKKSIIKSLYWCSNGRLGHDLLIQGFDNFLCEFSLHGHVDFEDTADFVLQNLKEKFLTENLVLPFFDCSYKCCVKRAMGLV
jgi:hypothetical protein